MLNICLCTHIPFLWLKEPEVLATQLIKLPSMGTGTTLSTARLAMPTLIACVVAKNWVF